MIEKVKLGDKVEFQRGFDLTHENMNEGPYPVVGSSSIIGFHNNYKAEDGITIGRSGTVGIPQLIKGKYWPHNTSLFTTDLKGNDLDYLYYLLVNLHIDKLKTGSNIPTLNRNDIYPLEVPFEIDVMEQKKVANVLKVIELKISNNTAICSDLESMAKLLYDYWFVQFDFPDENGRPYKSSGGKMVWNEELKREIPEGWESGHIFDLGDVIGGATPSTKNNNYYVEKGIGWITPNDLSNTDNKYISHGERDITEEAVASCSTTVMPRGTVLMSSRAPIGYLAIASDSLCTNQGFKSIVPKVFSSEFIYQTLSVMMPYIKNFGVGSTFAEVSKDELSNMRILLPKKSLENEFAKKTAVMSEQRELLEIENQQLASLRDFLLPMLMNGQVKVGKAGV